MKRKAWVAGIVGVVAIAIVVAVVLLWSKRFTLSDEYVGRSGIENVNIDELKTIIDEGKSFAVLVYQPDCRTSEDLEHILDSFGKRKEVMFLKVAYSDLKQSELIPELKYYPSVVLYRDGKVVDFLEANKDEDANAYTTGGGFQEWWEKYIK